MPARRKNSQEAVSLTKIAETCGVSRMTVSRALRNLPSVKPELGERIRAEAARLGYQSDPWLARLMTATRLARHQDYRETIAFIWTGHDRFAMPEFLGAKHQAGLYQFRVDEFFPKEEGITGRRMAEVLEARGIRGVILAPDAGRGHPHYWLPPEKFAAVILGKSLRNKGAVRVQHDHYDAAVRAMIALRRHGYRRPGLVVDPKFHERSWRTYAAAMAAYAPGPIDLGEAVWNRTPIIGPVDASILDWIGSYEPDSIILQNGYDAHHIEKLGIRIPDDLGLVALNLDETETRWTGISQNKFQIGQEAMMALAGILQNPARPLDIHSPTLNIAGTWLPGTSLASRLKRHKRRHPAAMQAAD